MGLRVTVSLAWAHSDHSGSAVAEEQSTEAFGADFPTMAGPTSEG